MTEFGPTLANHPRRSWLLSLFGGTGWAIAATYGLGARTLVAAPGIVAIAILPELAQHAAEIHLGMFESKAAFGAFANDPLRWSFAYPKLAGFAIATLAIARFWSVGSVRRALLVPPATLLRLLLAAGVMLAAELPIEWLKTLSTSTILDGLLTGALLFVQAGLLVYLVCILLDARQDGLRAAFLDRWPSAILLILLVALAFAPTQALHSAHHLAAFGQPGPALWSLMIFDSLWVGFMAALLGSALFVGCRAGPTLRGWGERPSMNWVSDRPG